MDDHENLPDEERARLKRVVELAISAQSGDFSQAGDRRFQTTFAKEIAALVEAHGLAATLHSLLVYENELGLPCSISFLGRGDVSLPESTNGVNSTVANAIFLRSTSVRGYVAGDDDLFGECRLTLFEGLEIVVPAWEASMVIDRLRADIEADRQRRIAWMEG